ncbi:MAG TPA: peptidase T, partial [Pirellulaceae bacterium]
MPASTAPIAVPRSALLARFLRYVQINTQADPASGTYPSSPGQLELGRILAEELVKLGLRDVEQNAHGLVYATLPSNVDRDVPVIAWNSHMDTSPEAPGEGVQPQVIENYGGGDVVLPGDPTKVIRVSECPELDRLHGATLVTTDGTTLLGADDKAGIAVIVEAARTLLDHPEIPHGEIRVLFTCDEEIGHGVDHVDLKKLGAFAGYTLDGSGADAIDTETFSADLAVVKIQGVNIHPSIAKGRMFNAIRGAGRFLGLMPEDLSPERTDGRAGFLHPYTLEGQVDLVTFRVLLRDFETPKLAEQAELLRSIARQVETQSPGIRVEIEVIPQYRNLREGLMRHPEIVELAERAHRDLGRTPRREIVRGGTDGSRLTELG